jgi:hypothetical protein
MTPSEQERKSTRVVSELIGDTYDKRGYERILGEGARVQEPPPLSLNDGQAQMMHSTEMNRRAVDLYLVIDGHDPSSGEA